MRRALDDHVVAYLEIDEDTAWARATADGITRPLAADRERFATLLRERRPVYEAAADAFLSGDAIPAAAPALRALAQGHEDDLGRPHPVFLGDDAWPETRDGDYLVTDEHVERLHGERFGRCAAT